MVSVSSTKFPNTEFKRSPDFAKIVKKLYWSCKESTTRWKSLIFDTGLFSETRFGFKRRLLNTTFPGLCDYYDQYFYQNTQITKQIEDENDAIIRFFTNDEEEYFGVEGFSTLAEVKSLTNMPTEDFQNFKTIVLDYCKENLAKVVAFFPSPYVKKYILEEVWR